MPDGTKYAKDILLDAIAKHIKRCFQTYHWKDGSTNVTFYVDNYDTAEALEIAKREIVMSDGLNLIIEILEVMPTVDAEQYERIKSVMTKRYNPENKSLDLTDFCADLKEISSDLPIISMALCAFDIIAQSIPDVQALNLERNHIKSLDVFEPLLARLPNLKMLNLADNYVCRITVFDYFCWQICVAVYN